MDCDCFWQEMKPDQTLIEIQVSEVICQLRAICIKWLCFDSLLRNQCSDMDLRGLWLSEKQSKARTNPFPRRSESQPCDASLPRAQGWVGHLDQRPFQVVMYSQPIQGWDLHCSSTVPLQHEMRLWMLFNKPRDTSSEEIDHVFLVQRLEFLWSWLSEWYLWPRYITRQDMETDFWEVHECIAVYVSKCSLFWDGYFLSSANQSVGSCPPGGITGKCVYDSLFLSVQSSRGAAESPVRNVSLQSTSSFSTYQKSYFWKLYPASSLPFRWVSAMEVSLPAYLRFFGIFWLKLARVELL